MKDIEKRRNISVGDYVTAGFLCLLGLSVSLIALFRDKNGWALFVLFPYGVVTLYTMYLIVCSLLED